MRIELKKFGNVLSSRPAGREAWLAAQAYILSEVKNHEEIEVDFSDIAVLSPSWADEFITSLKQKYRDSVKLLPSSNSTVKATLDMIK